MTDSQPTPPPIRDGTKTTLNALAAGLFVLLSLWLVGVDFAFPGDALFQTSPVLYVYAFAAFLGFFITMILAPFPKRYVIGINLLLTLRFAFGYPLNLGMGNSLACRIVSVILLLLSVLWLVKSLRHWTAARPWIALRHSLIAIAAFVVLSVLSIPIMVGGLSAGLQNLVGDYVGVSFTGISLRERVFEKDNQRVHLVGMMHIGDGAFYKALNKRLSARTENGERRLVLTEGVGDREKVLPQGFKDGGTYGKFADKLGLELQQEFGEKPKEGDEKRSPEEVAMLWAARGITFENADMDVSDLDPAHRDRLVELLTLLEGGDLMAIMFSSSLMEMDGLEIESLLMDGLLGTRNDALMVKFDELAADYQEVYIPWGAAHLGDIEDRLLERGYTETSDVKRPIVRFFGGD